MSVETELKLQVDPERLKRIHSHALIAQLRLSQPETRLQTSVYFDTPDFRLLGEKMVLRVRHIGPKRIQGLKSLGSCNGGAWARQEWEVETSSDIPELERFHGHDLPALLSDSRLPGLLAPVFTTEVNRTIYRLGDGDWEVELAMDQGRVRAAAGELPISEVELELKSGEPYHLFDLALGLHQDLDARLITASKSQRGFGLLQGHQLAPQKATPLNLDRHCTAAQAFRAIALSCVTQLVVNQECLLETKDPEAIHQMRVAIRRLKAGMSIFKPMIDTPQTRELRDELRWLSNHLGAARDTDVFIEEIIAPLAETYAQEPGYAALREDLLARKQALYDDALQALQQPRFTRLMLSLGRWSEYGDWAATKDPVQRSRLEQAARAVGTASLAGRDKKALKRLRHLAKLDPQTRHLARIQVKKLRYSIELFSSLYPEHKPHKLSQALSKLQDRLGLLNDIAVSREQLNLQALVSGDMGMAWAAGLVAGWHAARVAGLLTLATADAKAYRRLSRFWRDDL